MKTFLSSILSICFLLVNMGFAGGYDEPKSRRLKKEINRNMEKSDLASKENINENKMKFCQQYLAELNEYLDLHREQKEKIELIITQNIEKFNTKKEEFRALISDVMNKNNEAISKILNREQRIKFENINKEKTEKMKRYKFENTKKTYKKWDFYNKPEYKHEKFLEKLKKDLGLTNEQIENIETILKANWEEIKARKDNFFKEIEELKNEKEDSIKLVLNKKQNKKFTKNLQKTEKELIKNEREKEKYNEMLENRQKEYIAELKEELSLTEKQIELVKEILKDEHESKKILKENFKKDMERIKERSENDIKLVLDEKQASNFEKKIYKKKKHENYIKYDRDNFE
ncbi:MAG: hypothetical protein LBF97_04525 [Elusimicrobiota bacterium]|jgi:chromosome segregation protein|nr:hypothetical protein [Elusimicrobiota bacterium]